MGDAARIGDELAGLVIAQLEALADRHAPDLTLPRVFAGHPVGPDAHADLAYTLMLARRLGVEAIGNRPEVAVAALRERIAAATRTAARAAFLPQVSAQGAWELDGGTWQSRASSWAVGAVARVNIFRGFADRARLAEAGEQAARRALERTKAETAVRLDVHVAAARLDAARAAETVGRDAVLQARESRRIIRDRYDAGLTDVTSLLRSAEAVAQADAQQVAAQVAVLTASADLQRALGRR